MKVTGSGQKPQSGSDNLHLCATSKSKPAERVPQALLLLRFVLRGSLQAVTETAENTYPPRTVRIYLQTYEPQELVHFGGSTYCTREHDSLKISNGKWCWFSRGIGGKTALDYLIKVKELPFTEAVERIVGRVAERSPVFHARAQPEKPKTLLLPPKSNSSTRVIAYLKSRGIDGGLIEQCIRSGQLYESLPYHNAVFVGMDRNGTPRYACLRGIGTDFKGEATGSDKRFSFALPATGESRMLCVFESAIDLLSYATMAQAGGLSWRSQHVRHPLPGI